MLDVEKLNELISSYKKDIENRKNNIQYKLDSVNHFQRYWNIDTDDFKSMFIQSTQKTKDILRSNSGTLQPRPMMIHYLDNNDSIIRNMFKKLFDDDADVMSRIDNFINEADILQKNNSHYGQLSYQDLRACSSYLWLRYPEKYYIYKYSNVKTLSKILYNNETVKTKDYKKCLQLYDDVNQYLINDKELNTIKNKFNCYDGNPLIFFHIVTCDFIEFINNLHNEDTKVLITDNQNTTSLFENKDEKYYTKENFLEDVYISELEYDELLTLLKNKKNIILQGAPGVGKTYMAKRLAYSMMGKKDNNRIKMVQFHQNYTYEDFVMGYKPDGDGFKLEKGIFYNFCKKAEKSDEEFFLIIDEINRGNMSKIFGELLMLIEKDYRGKKHAIQLAYSKEDEEEFNVPENLYIIGMLNTADRSLAMMDYALRRRFSFYDIKPRFTSAGFKKYQQTFDNKTFNDLIKRIEELNKEIEKDSSLGSGFCIGHSYFCNLKECTTEHLKSVVKYEIIPMLREYWFDDNQKVETWTNKLESVFND